MSRREFSANTNANAGFEKGQKKKKSKIERQGQNWQNRKWGVESLILVVPFRFQRWKRTPIQVAFTP